MRLRKSYIYLSLFSIFLLYTKYFLVIPGTYWETVDNSWYLLFFDRLRNVNLNDVIRTQFSAIGAIEPISAFYYFLMSKILLSKFIPAATSFLYMTLFIACLPKITIYTYLLVSLYSFGFYEFILFDVAHRLKIAGIVFLIIIFLNKNKVFSFLWLPALAHLSTTLIIFPMYIYSKLSARIGFAVFFVLLIYGLLQVPITAKFLSNKFGFFDFSGLNIIIASLLSTMILFSTFFFERLKRLRLIIFIFFVVLILLLIGRSRYFMLLYFMFQYLYIFFNINWYKFRGTKLNLGDLIFVVGSGVSIYKSEMVFKFFLTGYFDV